MEMTGLDSQSKNDLVTMKINWIVCVFTGIRREFEEPESWVTEFVPFLALNNFLFVREPSHYFSPASIEEFLSLFTKIFTNSLEPVLLT